jgi:hypothetical protein
VQCLHVQRDTCHTEKPVKRKRNSVLKSGDLGDLDVAGCAGEGGGALERAGVVGTRRDARPERIGVMPTAAASA